MGVENLLRLLEGLDIDIVGKEFRCFKSVSTTAAKRGYGLVFSDAAPTDAVFAAGAVNIRFGGTKLYVNTQSAGHGTAPTWTAQA